MTSVSRGPVVERALLTAELKRLRQHSGKRQQDVAGDLEWSASKFTRIENGASPVTKTDLEGLLRYYGVDDPDQLTEWTTRARFAREKGWWEEYGIDDRAFETFIGYEDGAASYRTYQSVIPGLLQIPSYTKILVAAYGVPPERIERLVQLRLERQRRMAERETRQVYVLDESALVRPTGNAMPDQLRHLAAVARTPHVTIHVIPFSHGPHAGLQGPFVLLGFDGPLDSVLYLENAGSGDLLIAETREQVTGSGATAVADPAAEVAKFEDAFESLERLALDPEESIQFIEKTAEHMSSGE
jgi:transcriptional regulator with XRE-family HTH domain